MRNDTANIRNKKFFLRLKKIMIYEKSLLYNSAPKPVSRKTILGVPQNNGNQTYFLKFKKDLASLADYYVHIYNKTKRHLIICKFTWLTQREIHTIMYNADNETV